MNTSFIRTNANTSGTTTVKNSDGSSRRHLLTGIFKHPVFLTEHLANDIATKHNYNLKQHTQKNK